MCIIATHVVDKDSLLHRHASRTMHMVDNTYSCQHMCMPYAVYMAVDKMHTSLAAWYT